MGFAAEDSSDNLFYYSLQSSNSALMASGSGFGGGLELLTTLIICFVFYRGKMKNQRLMIKNNVLIG
ncbi:hypothetical protein [Persicobacter sp. CCB-QB2]|uniref:hypothetical protein n=1 Tax=Persicobacter sp. CCB-QB2 TaxID=1561025 RepID=UPI0006A99683|nr:hypothetical protein [Persicobacter sp. CCB-QB2]